MAECVLVPYSARGHVNPFLAVAAELVARGHRVSVVVGARYAPAVTAVGARSVCVGVDHVARVPAGWHPEDVAARVKATADRWHAQHVWAASCRQLVLRVRPDVVVADPHMSWALRLPGRPIPLWTTHARPLRGQQRVLVNCLPQLQPRRGRLSGDHRFVGPLLGGVRDNDEHGLSPTRMAGPVLVVSMGTVFARRPDFLRGIAAAFTGSEWTVVLATGQTPVAALGELPPNVVAKQWIPQWRLLAHADALITHGGMNSVQEAVVRGVPMIVAPRSREQRRTAELVRRWGVGCVWPGLAGIRRAVERAVHDPRMRAAVQSARHLTAQRDARALAADELLRSV